MGDRMNKRQADIEERWQNLGFAEPTPIQELAWPAIAAGQSVYLQARTGSGKTLAYLLPLMEQIEANQQLQALILAPSQELALQIVKVGRQWADIFGLSIQAVVGGVNLKRQLEALKTKAEIIVATPGRLLQILEQTRKIKTPAIKHLVIDEADFLIDQDHRKELLEIRRRLPAKLQFILVSATVDQAIFQEFQSSTQEIELIQAKEINHQLTHRYILCQQRRKLDALRRLGHVPGMQALVFMNHIDQVDRAYQYLRDQQIEVLALHSQLHSTERKTVLTKIHGGQFSLLLTTDIASRGLDIANVPYVVHFDLATDLANYLHRSGRTGRMGQAGTVLSLVNEQEARDLNNLLADAEVDLRQAFLYQGQISDQPLKQDSQQKEQNQSQVYNKPKKKIIRQTQTSPSKKIKVKKDRHKDRKNKGKPRKKV